MVSSFMFYGNQQNSLFEKIDNQYSEKRIKNIDICKKECLREERKKLFSQKEISYCGR